jgi:hypothetical protein
MITQLRLMMGMHARVGGKALKGPNRLRCGKKPCHQDHGKGNVNSSASEAFLGEPCAGGRSLAGLELRIRFTDHVNRALALHDLAISVTALGGGEGRKDFHGGKWCEFKPIARANRGAKASPPAHLVKSFLDQHGNFPVFPGLRVVAGEFDAFTA